MLRIGVLGSTRGTSLLPILMAIEKQLLPVDIGIVLSDKEDAIILERARAHQIVAEFVNPAGLTREAYAKTLSARLRAYQVDFILLIGYMRLLPAAFVNEWRDQIINVHPSLLPAFAGSMNNNVHAAVLASGVEETGCTVHYVTEEVDAGPILVQKTCPVLPDDTVDTLKKRVQALEGLALIEAIKKVI